jgi:CheY-like chemotaxis protein
MRGPVLVVEDNEPNRELISDWLETQGYAVCTAENLREAFAAVKDQSPCAVLLDVQLGSEDGLSFAAWIRKQEDLQSMPVIAVTAHAMVTDQERVMRAGCSACISKPIDFKQLREQLLLWLSVTTTFEGESSPVN